MAFKRKSSTRLLMLAVVLLGALVVFFQWQQFRHSSLHVGNENIYVTVSKGDGLNKVLPKLRMAGITRGADWQWKLLALQLKMANRIHVGDYVFLANETPVDVLQKLGMGDTDRVKFSIIDGWTFAQLKQQLKSNSELTDDISGKTDAQLMQFLGRAGMHPEGRFLPDTYLLPRSATQSELLLQALLAMDETLAKTWEARGPNLPYRNADELLTMASIVEKETGKASDRAHIAGVFVSRLKIGMPLQTDPAVIYGMGDLYQGNIRKKDLRTDTPYNTYTRRGLTPTPISMPGKAALLASANPVQNGSLYFVAKGNGDSHFSKTYAEHQKAVQQFQMK